MSLTSDFQREAENLPFLLYCLGKEKFETDVWTPLKNYQSWVTENQRKELLFVVDVVPKESPRIRFREGE